MEMTKISNLSELDSINESWNLTFVGEKCDDRTNLSVDFCSSKCEQKIVAKYDHDDLSISFDDEDYQCYQIEEFVRAKKVKRILLDATSLGVAELGLLLKVMSGIKRLRCSLVYVEPGSYSPDETSGIGFNSREFSLSAEVGGFRGIPMLSKPLNLDDDKVVVFFLGFESYRLKHALEELNISPSQCSLVFGVPSFRPGWEVDAFANNIKCISDNDLEGRVYFCGADNPDAVLSQLREIRTMIGKEKQITVIPIGSKPHSIGASIYCSYDSNSNMVYDHPMKKNGRTTDVGPLHIYRLTR